MPLTAARRAIINGRNARRSTGPRTTRGKSVSRFNSRTHGLTSRRFASVPEDASAYQTHLLETIRIHNPQSITELRIVVFLAASSWLIQRANRMELNFTFALTAEYRDFIANLNNPQAKQSGVRRSALFPLLRMPSLEPLSRHRARLDRHYHRMREVLRTLRKPKNEAKKRTENAALRYFNELPAFVRNIIAEQLLMLQHSVISLRSKIKNEKRSQKRIATPPIPHIVLHGHRLLMNPNAAARAYEPRRSPPHPNPPRDPLPSKWFREELPERVVV